MGRNRGENIATVKCRAGWLQLKLEIGQLDNMVGLLPLKRQAQHPIVRTDKVTAIKFKQNRPARAANSWVDHHHMDRAGWKIAYGVLQDQRSSQDILCWHTVAQIDDLYLRIDRRDDAFHDPNEGILVTEVGGKSNHQSCRQSCSV